MIVWELLGNIKGAKGDSVDAARIESDDLILTLDTGEELNAGNVRGAQGLPGALAETNDAQVAGFIETSGASLTKTAMRELITSMIPTFVVRERASGESTDDAAFADALTLANAAEGAVVVWPAGRNPTLLGGHVQHGSVTVDFANNHVTHTGNNVMLDYLDPEGLTGIGELTGGVRNLSVQAEGAAYAGANACAIRASTCWGYELTNVEVLNYSAGVGVWLRNVDTNSWTEGTRFSNVMLNMCKVALRFSHEGVVPSGVYSSFAYTNIESLSINLPIGGVAIEATAASGARVWLYHSLLNVVFWMRQGSTAFKADHNAMIHKNVYHLRAEGQDSPTAMTFFQTVAGAQITGVGSITTISEAVTTMHSGAGRVQIASPSGDASYDSRNVTTAGSKFRTNAVSDADDQGNALNIARSGWETGDGINRPFFAGYNGVSDVLRAYGIPYNSPDASGWKLFFGAANGRITIGNQGGATVAVSMGAGSPEGQVTAPQGSLFLRTDGATSTTLYVKTSGTGNTGWVAK